MHFRGVRSGSHRARRQGKTLPLGEWESGKSPGIKALADLRYTSSTRYPNVALASTARTGLFSSYE